MTFHPTQRIESYGSMWLIDETSMQYVRTPKSESPRKSPPGEDWGGVDAPDGLVDLALNPFTKWKISRHHYTLTGNHADGSRWTIRRRQLIIKSEAGGVRAPMMPCDENCLECT